MQPTFVPAEKSPPGTPSATVDRAVDAGVRPRSAGRRRWLPGWSRRGAEGSGTDILDACADAVLGIGPDGRIRFVNAAGRALLAGPAELIVGRPADELVPDLAAAAQQARSRGTDDAGTGPDGATVDLTATAMNGVQIPVGAWFTPVPAHRGTVLVAATLRDLRPQQETDDHFLRLDAQLHDTRAVVSAVLKAVTDRAVVLADAEGYITKVNRAAEKLLGYRSDELVGRPTTRLSDPADLAEVAHELGVATGVDPVLELARWGLPNRQDWDYLTKDGLRRPVSLSVTAVGDRDAPTGFVCVASDRSVGWQNTAPRRGPGDRLLLDLDDAATRVLRWGVGRTRAGA